MLPKCWRRVAGEIKLYKGGTFGASNTGNEPYCEYYAAQIAKEFDISTIDYGLSKWQGKLCSTCALFTSREYAFLPVGKVVTSGGMEAVTSYYEKIGEAYAKALADMLVLDAIICNTDRYFGNSAFLVDNRTNEIVAPAPLFDHGNSLFNFAGKDDLAYDAALTAYAQTLMPRVHDDFIGTAKAVLIPEHREGLRYLMNFRFKRHSLYNLSKERLVLLEKQVQKTGRRTAWLMCIFVFFRIVQK